VKRCRLVVIIFIPRLRHYCFPVNNVIIVPFRNINVQTVRRSFTITTAYQENNEIWKEIKKGTHKRQQIGNSRRKTVTVSPINISNATYCTFSRIFAQNHLWQIDRVDGWREFSRFSAYRAARFVSRINVRRIVAVAFTLRDDNNGRVLAEKPIRVFSRSHEWGSFAQRRCRKRVARNVVRETHAHRAPGRRGVCPITRFSVPRTLSGLTKDFFSVERWKREWNGS